MSSVASTESGGVVQTHSASPASPSHARLLKRILSLALIFLVLTVYWPCRHFPFISFDDPEYVSSNPHVQAGLTRDSIRWAFTAQVGGNWSPLIWLSLQLDAVLYGGSNAGGFHLTNVILHAASSVLLFLVLCGMTGSTGRSALTAALFALHPLNVESVAWITERKNTLSTLFWMLSLAAYLGYVRRPGIGRYLLVLAALTLGLMSKAAVVTLPCVLLLLDYWPLERWPRKPHAAASQALPAVTPRFLVLEKLPLFALVLTGSIVTYIVQSRTPAVQSLQKYPLDVRVLNALQAYVIYGIKTLWPMDLAVYYPHSGKAISVAAALASGVLLAGVTLLVLGPGRRRPYLAVGWFWYLGTLVPMIGLVQIAEQALADRYAYLPTIGLFLMLVWGGADLAERLALSISLRIAAAVLGVVFCCILTSIQLGYWKSDKVLWERALAVTPNNAFAHVQLGLLYSREGPLARAEKEMQAAVAIQPDSPTFQSILARLLQRLGRLEEALSAFRKASDLSPQDAIIRMSLANVLHDLGRNEEALPEYRKSLALDPDQAIVHCNLANLLVDLGRPEEAQEEYRQAIALAPTYASPHLGLGRIFEERGQHAEARAEYRRALELSPQNGVAQYNLALTLYVEGRLESAEIEYRKAWQLGQTQAATQVQLCQRLRMLQPRLRGLLAGQDRPANNGERLAFAELCQQPFVRCYAKAAELYAEAFRQDSALADDPRTGYRTAAALAAARAGCGQGRDAADLKDEAKAQLRRQALDWLLDDLARWKQWAERPDARPLMVQTLRNWLKDDGLAGVREPAALARLPQKERSAWQKLWQEIKLATDEHR